MYEYDPLWHRMEETLRIIADDPDAEWIDVCEVPAMLAPHPAA